MKLLDGEAVPVRGSVYEDKVISSHEAGWNYVDTQEDIDFIMREAYGFHDSVLKKIEYIPDSYIPKAIFTFDIQGSALLEMVCEAVIALNIRRDAGYIFGAMMFVNDCTIYFCDGYVTGADTSYNGTWVTSYGLKWRFIK